MQTLFVHVGHVKTGSTALQNFFATNLNLLTENRIFYPINSDLLNASKKGRITSGNGLNILEELSLLKNPPDQDLLFSSEILFYKAMEPGFRSKLLKKAAKLNLKVVFICYTRDFFPYAFSAWGQYIKREKGTLSFSDFMLTDQNIPKTLYLDIFSHLKNLLEFSTFENFELKVFNYERVKSNIEQHFYTEGLGLKNFPENYESITSNRSLTYSEREFVRLFNKFYLGKSSNFLNDPLVEKAPTIKADVPYFSETDYLKIYDKYIGTINQLNELLDEEQHLSMANYETYFSIYQAERYVFNQLQLEIITRSIAEKINQGVYDSDPIWKILLIKSKRFLENFRSYRS